MTPLKHYSHLCIPCIHRNSHAKKYVEHEYLQQKVEQIISDFGFTQTLNNSEINQLNIFLWNQSTNDSLSYKYRVDATASLRCYVSWCLLKRATDIFNRYKNVSSEELSIALIVQKFLGDVSLDLKVFIQHSSEQELGNNTLVKLGSDNELNTSQVEELKNEYWPLSFTVLESWQPNRSSVASLTYWVDQKTRNASLLKTFGINISTHWFILLHSPNYKLDLLSGYEQNFVVVFRGIYGVEVDLHRRSKRGALPPPTADQLQRIKLAVESKLGIDNLTVRSVEENLIKIANQLRSSKVNRLSSKDDFASLSNPETNYDSDIVDAVEEAIDDLGGYLAVLKNAVVRVFDTHHELINETRVQHREWFKEICRLYYVDSLSQGAIAKQFGCNQATISRILKPGVCLNNTIAEYVEAIMSAAADSIYMSDEPDDIAAMEKYIREETFQKFDYKQILKSLFS